LMLASLAPDDQSYPPSGGVAERHLAGQAPISPAPLGRVGG
jgi:hypothetical protein